MELRQLEVFVAVAEERSFTSAADRLHVVQSAVSASIRALEGELGASLLERTTRRVALSDAGAALLPEARAVLAAAGLARDAVEQTKGGLRGAVALGIMQAWAYPALSVPRIVAEFQRDHPLVELTVRHVGGSGVLAEAVRDGALDLGFLSLPGSSPGLELTELTSEPMRFACTTGHRLAGAERVSLAEIAGETFADGPPSWGTRLAADRAFERAGIERSVRFEVNEMTTIIEFVRAGVGVALLHPSIVADRPEIITVPVDGEPIPFRTLLAASAQRRPTAAARALAASILAQVAATPLQGRSPRPLRRTAPAA